MYMLIITAYTVVKSVIMVDDISKNPLSVVSCRLFVFTATNWFVLALCKLCDSVVMSQLGGVVSVNTDKLADT